MTTAPAQQLAAIGQANAGDAAISTISSSSASPSIDAQVGGLPDRGLHRRRVELAVGLGARPADRRTLAAVEHAKLDAAGIGDPAHQSVQRIDLADQMTLAQTADRGVAGHRADGRKAMGHQRRPRAHPRGGAGGLAAGMAAADDDDVE